jgi:hypothetical protein
MDGRFIDILIIIAIYIGETYTDAAGVSPNTHLQSLLLELPGPRCQAGDMEETCGNCSGFRHIPKDQEHNDVELGDFWGLVGKLRLQNFCKYTASPSNLSSSHLPS